jgi:DNA-binding FrmR family transcriptional regulator
MRREIKASVLKRLKRVEGGVRGRPAWKIVELMDMVGRAER